MAGVLALFHRCLGPSAHGHGPIGRHVLELWGLVHYIERDQMLLGSLPTFKDLFCESTDGHTLASGQAHELRRRLGGVIHRP